MRDYCSFASMGSYGGYDGYTPDNFYVGSQYLHRIDTISPSSTDPRKLVVTTKPKYELPDTDSLKGLPNGTSTHADPTVDETTQINEIIKIHDNTYREGLNKLLDDDQLEQLKIKPRKKTVKFLLWNIKAIKHICKID
jgi:hypothetical protein